MKVTFVSAVAMALAMSIGSASAEEQNSAAIEQAAAPVTEQFSIMKNIPSAIPMNDEQLDETFGEGYVCEPTRRRWFDRSGPIGEPT